MRGVWECNYDTTEVLVRRRAEFGGSCECALRLQVLRVFSTHPRIRIFCNSAKIYSVICELTIVVSWWVRSRGISRYSSHRIKEMSPEHPYIGYGFSWGLLHTASSTCAFPFMQLRLCLASPGNPLQSSPFQFPLPHSFLAFTPFAYPPYNKRN